MKLKSELKEDYSPAFFLAALGNGGLAITFFMYLQFLTPHKGSMMAHWGSLYPLINQANLMSVMIVTAMAGMLYFTFRHLRVTLWNIKEYTLFRSSDSFSQVKKTNAAVSFMAYPLSLAMSVNVLFASASVFVPGTWLIAEYLFPLAILAFLGVGALAFRFFLPLIENTLIHGHFDCDKNNNLSQMLAAFTFSMIAVGLSAASAISQVTLTGTIATLAATFFLVLAGIIGSVTMFNGFKNLMQNGVSLESTPSFWIVIPIITLFGISLIRLIHGYEHLFHFKIHGAVSFLLLSVFISIQVIFGALGYFVMKKAGYFKEYITGPKKSPLSYSLVCPGVAFIVMSYFFIHVGLVKNHMIAKFDLAHLVLLAPLVFLQVKTIMLVFKLDKKLLHSNIEKPTLNRLKAIKA